MRGKTFVCFATFCFLLLLCFLAPAKADIPVTLVGQWGGACNAAAVSGTTAYMGAGPRILALDISDPSSPALLGMSDVLPDSVADVAISGNYAYVADGGNWTGAGLLVIDISNVSSPICIGSCVNHMWGSAYAVAVSGNYAYVADNGGGLQVINISNPHSPNCVGRWSTTAYSQDVAVSGSYAYVADDHAGLQVIDISNPSSPTRVGGYDTTGDATGVAVSGNYAYVADWHMGLQVIDISDPSSPIRVGGYDTGGFAHEVAVSGDYAYVADDYAGLQVIDISNPSSPTRVGGYYTGGDAVGLAVNGSWALVADGGGGLQIIDVFNPLSPTRVGGYNTSGLAYDVALSGNYAYVADIDPGLQVIDISNPLSPTFVGGCDINGNARAIAVSGNYAYMACDMAGLQVINTSDPCLPDPVGVYDTPGYAYDVDVSGSYAYVADYDSGLQVINISDPSSPALVGAYNTSGDAMGIAVSGSYAYIADGDAGLQIISVSNPSNPYRIGGYDTTGSACRVAISDNYAYVADGYQGLQVINVSNPASPFRVGGISGQASDVAVSGNYAYVAGYNMGGNGTGLQVIDISNPSSPTWVGEYDTSGAAEPSSVKVSGTNAYVANRDGGLVILRVGGTAPPTVNAITPNSGLNTGGVTITSLAGADFQTGATVKLTRAGHSDISATDVTVVTTAKIMCSFPLNGAAPGLWNVVVTNPDGQTAALINAFTVTSPPPTVTIISPNSGRNTGPINITYLAGTNFYAGAAVKLAKAGQSDVLATNVVLVDNTWITCTLDLTGVAPGPWSVVVTNTDGQSGTLNNGFIVNPPPTVTSVSPNSGCNTAVIYPYVWGANFMTGAAVKLTKAGQSDIVGTSVNVLGSGWIVCRLDLRGKATGEWNVVVTNPDAQTGTLVNGFAITLDTSPPIISLVSVSPPMAAGGDLVRVAVDVTDNVAVTGVTANGTALTYFGGSSWSGDIPADPLLGLHTVTVAARDAADNIATDSSQSYRTAQLLGITNRNLSRDVLAGSAAEYLFATWGRVTWIDADTFDLNDGSGTPIRVIKSDHGLEADDFAIARGIWSLSASPHTLNASHVTQIQ